MNKILSIVRKLVTRIALRVFVGEKACREEMYAQSLIGRLEDIDRMTRRAKNYAHLLSVQEMVEEFGKDYHENPFVEVYVMMLEKGIKDRATVLKLNMRDKRSLVHEN